MKTIDFTTAIQDVNAATIHNECALIQTHAFRRLIAACEERITELSDAALAEAMPFVMGRMTATRAVQKLYNLGLITRHEDNRLYAVQIATESVQNAISPITPLNNNMNELKKEEKQPRALYAHAGAKQR